MIDTCAWVCDIYMHMYAYVCICICMCVCNMCLPVRIIIRRCANREESAGRDVVELGGAVALQACDRQKPPLQGGRHGKTYLSAPRRGEVDQRPCTGQRTGRHWRLELLRGVRDSSLRSLMARDY